MGLKRWTYASIDSDKAVELQRQLSESGIEVPLLAARILQGRGYDLSVSLELLGVSASLKDPYSLIDMDKAVERIWQAIESEERIAVYGDYDCDGVTATALLCSYLESNGADVLPYIPTREDGYGLNKAAIRYLSDMGVTLIVTVDNGISAYDEISYASTLGVDVVVTDHHQPPERLPDAVAVVDPHRKDCPSGCTNLAGVGVAFKLACAMEQDDGEELLEYYGMLTAIGTIGDVVPLTDENRLIVQRGLAQLSSEPSVGIAALLGAAGINGKMISSETVSFGIVPRINAMGRMGDASLALRLLMEEDPDSAQELAQQVDSANRERREVEQKILGDIAAQIQKHPMALQQRAILLAGRGWHHGIIGIVAARLVERFGKPCLLVTEEEPGSARGSARSVEGFSIIDAITACKEHLTGFGGHPMAAGLSLDTHSYAAFRKAFLEYAKETYKEMPVYTVHVDAVLSPSDLKVETIKSLSVLEPFGAGNEAPVFAIRGAKIDTITPLSEGKHLRLRLTQEGQGYQVLYFGMTPDNFQYRQGDIVDALVSVDINVYNGEERLSIKIKDMRLSSLWEEGFVSGQLMYEKLIRGEMLSPEEAVYALPTREETALVYRYLRETGRCVLQEETLYARLCERVGEEKRTNTCKMLVALDALTELNLIRRQGREITVVPNPGKVDLQSAGILQRLSAMAAAAAQKEGCI